MNKNEWIEFCLSLGSSYADTPFAKMEKGKSPTIVMRHLKNKKSFALFSERHEQLFVAVKQNPDQIEELRMFFEDITPAFHMNKTHWNDIRIGGDVADEHVKKMIQNSYNLIKPKR